MLTIGIATAAFVLGLWAGIWLGAKGAVWKYSTLGVSTPQEIEKNLGIKSRKFFWEK